MHDYEKEPLPEAWAWESPVSGGTWITHVRAGWGKPSPDATKFNLRPLYAADAFAGVGNPLIKQLRDALADIEEGYNPETPHMVKCWDKAREALYAADEFLASNV